MRCPGQDTGFWDLGAIFEVMCPQCGHTVEFFKDDTVRNCKKCGHEFVNPKMDFGCAAYCKYAEQCLGELSPDLLSQRDDLFKNRVAIEMKRYFERDFRRINHAMRVARYAEQLVKEIGGSPAVVLSAAYLHDIGIKHAELKYNSNEARYQEAEGPPVAHEILTRLGAKEELIDEVCDIIGHHHHPRAEETTNFKILYDADLMVNLQDQQKETPVESNKLTMLINRVFLTEKGKKLALKTLIELNTPKTLGG